MRSIAVFIAGALALTGCVAAEVDPVAAPDAGFASFLTEWEAAQTRFINGDPSQWKQHSSQGTDATILGGFGGYGEKGWDTVGARYDWASSQYRDTGATMVIDYLGIVVSGDLAYTVGIERQSGSQVGGQQDPGARTLRVTQVFRMEDGAWKLLHRHADPLIEKQVPSQ